VDYGFRIFLTFADDSQFYYQLIFHMCIRTRGNLLVGICLECMNLK